MYTSRLVIFVFLLFGGSLNAQGVFNQMADTSNEKMREYIRMMRIADKHQVRAEEELAKVLFYKSEARSFLDSANAACWKGKADQTNANLYLMKLVSYFNLATGSAFKADSVLDLAIVYKDSALLKNREAETYYLSLAQDYKPVTDQKDSAMAPVKTIMYTVQIGAGKMKQDYFNNVKDLETITPSDGIKRYITGRFATKEEALEFREIMIKAGYTDAFIRTLDSLHY